jgi:hypothetical protein
VDNPSLEVVPVSNTRIESVQVSSPPEQESRNAKAAKNDDAETPYYLWDKEIVRDGDHTKLSAFTLLRSFALRWWKRHTTKEFVNWLNGTYHDRTDCGEDFMKDKNSRRDCIQRCANSSWWEWVVGSRPLFWRWPKEYRSTIRDGVKTWVKGHFKSTKFLNKEKRIQGLENS